MVINPSVGIYSPIIRIPHCVDDKTQLPHYVLTIEHVVDPYPKMAVARKTFECILLLGLVFGRGSGEGFRSG